jgi:Mn2+/Fe2+ NRAMP family transporter
MTEDMQDTAVERDRQLLIDAKKKGKTATLGAYIKLSGPGWLQSAITLGGGSLSSSLYLGVLGGFALLWLQPLAMIIGITMLSAIGYVTLSTGEKPFQAINKHVNPVLGWGWLLATLTANCVWALPQFGLACGAFKQNLLPSVFKGMEANASNGIIAGSIALLCIVIVFFYDTKGVGVKIFDILLKLMVGVVVISFLGVVIYMTTKGALDWGAVGGGILPDLTMLWRPADTFAPSLDAVGTKFSQFWSDTIVNEQQDVLVAAAATAVGINMTFLLPYSMLKRGWNKTFRGLAVFDLSTGLFIPFILATGCVVIASASQFHTKPAAGLLGEIDPTTGKVVEPDKKLLGQFEGLAMRRIKHERGDKLDALYGPLAAEAKSKDKAVAKAAKDKIATINKGLIAALPEADRRMAAMLVRRDSFHLAQALSPLTGDVVAHYVFGIGVVGMAISSIIILMLINGFCICEMVDRPSTGWLYRLGCLMPAIGVLGPFIWSGAAPYLAIPTSVFGFILIPIAYTTFALLLNQKKLLGDNMPKGALRWIWNGLILVGVIAVTIGSVYMAHKKAGLYGIGAIVAFILLAVVVGAIQKAKKKAQAA